MGSDPCAGILTPDTMFPMAKRVLNPKIRQILMQSLLVLVFAAALGLAALVTRHVRMSMRMELDSGRYSLQVGEKHLLFITQWPWKVHGADYVISACGNSRRLPDSANRAREQQPSHPSPSART